MRRKIISVNVVEDNDDEATDDTAELMHDDVN